MAPLGMDVQESNFRYTNPRTGNVGDIAEIRDYGVNELKLNYMMWTTKPGIFMEKILPTLKQAAPINTTP